MQYAVMKASRYEYCDGYIDDPVNECCNGIPAMAICMFCMNVIMAV
jgi:hypothetical protein